MTGMPYFINAGTGLEKMPSQHAVGGGIGVTLNGQNPEESTHMITNGTVFGDLKIGPGMLKAEHPQN